MQKMDFTGSRIKEIRLKKGLTQKKLACMAKVSVDYLSDIERGKHRPSVKAIARIAAALGVSIAELKGGGLN